MVEAEILFGSLSAVATTAAAIAAYLSWSTSRASLRFQKNFAKNQTILLQLTTLMTNTKTLSNLLINAKSISDTEFNLIEPLFLEARDDYRKFILNGIIIENGAKYFQYSDFPELIDSINKSKIPLSNEINGIQRAIDHLI